MYGWRGFYANQWRINIVFKDVEQQSDSDDEFQVYKVIEFNFSCKSSNSNTTWGAKMNMDAYKFDKLNTLTC